MRGVFVIDLRGKGLLLRDVKPERNFRILMEMELELESK